MNFFKVTLKYRKYGNYIYFIQTIESNYKVTLKLLNTYNKNISIFKSIKIEKL